MGYCGFCMLHLRHFMEETIFITGASGFIGKALVVRLLKDSAAKLVLFSRTYTFEEYKENKRIVPVLGDINNLPLLIQIIEEYKVTTIFHLASEAIISNYIKSPRDAYLSTVYGVSSLLEAVRLAKNKVSKVLVGTSYKVYGRASPPYNEDTHFSPGNTYETAKACQDLIAQDYFRTFKVPVIIFRSVNIYGPGDTNLTRLVPKVFLDMRQNISPTIYSAVKDSKREFLYIDDLLDAILLFKEKASGGEVFCVGGENKTIMEVVEKIGAITKFTGSITIIDAPHVSETNEHVLDTTKLEKLGWERKTSLDDGLLECSRYYTAKE